jgi:hypothetical protein
MYSRSVDNIANIRAVKRCENIIDSDTNRCGRLQLSKLRALYGHWSRLSSRQVSARLDGGKAVIWDPNTLPDDPVKQHACGANAHIVTLCSHC